MVPEIPREDHGDTSEVDGKHVHRLLFSNSDLECLRVGRGLPEFIRKFIVGTNGRLGRSIRVKM